MKKKPIAFPYCLETPADRIAAARRKLVLVETLMHYRAYERVDLVGPAMHALADAGIADVLADCRALLGNDDGPTIT